VGPRRAARYARRARLVVEDDGALELASALDDGRPPRTIDLRGNVFEPRFPAGEALAHCAGVRLGGARRATR